MKISRANIIANDEKLNAFFPWSSKRQRYPSILYYCTRGFQYCTRGLASAVRKIKDIKLKGRWNNIYILRQHN